MVDEVRSLVCACPCRATTFTITGRPLGRFLCHCRICQSLYRQPFADVTAWWGGGIRLPKQPPVQFRRYRPPPALRRGTCASCGAPVVGLMTLLPFVTLAFIPARSFAEPRLLPAPRMHIFYHRRLEDASDALPKVSGYWASEFAVTRLILSRGRGAG